MKEIPYFVSYAHEHGFGSSQINMRLPIRSFDDVQVVAQTIAKANGFPSVTVLYWQRFETAGR